MLEPDFEIIGYNPDLKEVWNDFVNNSKNGTFLFNRGYMDYHAYRFKDHSFIFLKKGKIRALLPATLRDDTLSSHAGLTYGGLIMDKKITVSEILEIFGLLKERCRHEGINNLIYKSIPYIYHSLPSEEDLYALFRHNATLSARGVSSVIRQSDRLKFRDIRKRGIRKAVEQGIEITESKDFSGFWDILSANLQNKYSVTPVHSIEEITMLASRFEKEIKLYTAILDGEIIAGTVCYLTGNCAHSQYISASPKGKESGALDLLFDNLINLRLKDYAYFDFGISTEEGGRILNENLIYQKEGFGGRAVCYDTYIMKI